MPFDLPPEFFAFVAIGLAAQLVDGAIGMAYGVTSASLLMALGLAAGFLDAVGGGGWGPLATSHLVAARLQPRIAIGTANAAEFFVALATTVVFLGTLGVSHVHVVAGLLVGGVLAAPLSAWLARRVPARPLMMVVGLLVSGISLYNLLR
ncbi:MAG TPA: TSUP family transporter [Arenimonas sp.]|nr:TSUP family transporter [Arenimonas sp.]